MQSIVTVIAFIGDLKEWIGSAATFISHMIHMKLCLQTNKQTKTTLETKVKEKQNQTTTKNPHSGVITLEILLFNKYMNDGVRRCVRALFSYSVCIMGKTVQTSLIDMNSMNS